MLWLWPLYLPLEVVRIILSGLALVQPFDLPSGVVSGFATFLTWKSWVLSWLPSSTADIIWEMEYWIMRGVRFLTPLLLAIGLLSVFRRKK